MKKIKILKKVKERIDCYIDRPTDAFKSGYNVGLRQAIDIVEEEIKKLKKS